MNITLERIETLIEEVQSDILPQTYSERELQYALADLQDAKHIIRDEEHDGGISKTSLRKMSKLIKSAHSYLEKYFDGKDIKIENCLRMLEEAEELTEEAEEPMDRPVELLRVTDREIIMREPVVYYATHEEMEELWEICQRIVQRFKEGSTIE